METSSPLVAEYNEINNPTEISQPLTASMDQAMFKPASKKETQVWYNCLTVKMAVEEFAARNNGYYPCNVSCSRNLDGNTVIDLLPAGKLIQNPHTKYQTEPIDGAAACPGQVGYCVSIYNGRCLGYVITGCGRCSRIIVTIAKWPGYYKEAFTPDGPGSR